MHTNSGLVLESGLNTDSPLSRVLRQKDASTINIPSISIEQRERRKLGTPSRVTTNISPRLRVVGVISLSWVKMGDTRCHIWDMSVHLETEYPWWYIVGKLFNWFIDNQRDWPRNSTIEMLCGWHVWWQSGPVLRRELVSKHSCRCFNHSSENGTWDNAGHWRSCYYIFWGQCAMPKWWSWQHCERNVHFQFWSTVSQS